ncbi:MAG TPA: kelch repeat-containing protein, partial [Myxococcota bacterium]
GLSCDAFTGLCGASCNSDHPCLDAGTACSRAVCLPSCIAAPPDLVCSSVNECCDLVNGNCTRAPVIMSDTWQYDDTSGGAFNQIFPATTPPARTGAALASNFPGRLVLFGGRGDDGALLADTWFWLVDSQSFTFEATTSAPSPRVGHAMAELPFQGQNDNGTLLFGGSDDGGVIAGEAGFVFLPPAWIPVTGAAPPPRTDAAMAFDGNLTVYLFGGRDSSGAVLADVWPFDIATDTWGAEISATGPSARAGHMMARDPLVTGSVVMVGGVDASGNVLSDAWTFDGAAWTQGADLPQPRAFAALAPDGNDELVLFGGFDGVDVADDVFVDAAGSFARGTEQRPNRRERPSAAFDGATPIVFGGDDVVSESVCPAQD